MSKVLCYLGLRPANAVDLYISEQRILIIDAIGPDLSTAALEDAILGGKNRSLADITFCDEILEVKDERERYS